MKKHLNEMQEYDKRIGVPQFEGWQEREIKAHKKAQTEQLNLHGVTHSCNICERDIVRTAITYDKVKICHSCLKFLKVQGKLNNRTWEKEVKFQSAYINNCG